MVACRDLPAISNEVPVNSLRVYLLQLILKSLNFRARKLFTVSPASLTTSPCRCQVAQTFDLVFASDMDRSMEINFSCIAGSPSVSLPSLARRFARSDWHTSSRVVRRAISFGEYEDSAFRTICRIFWIVLETWSRSLAE